MALYTANRPQLHVNTDGQRYNLQCNGRADFQNQSAILKNFYKKNQLKFSK